MPQQRSFTVILEPEEDGGYSIHCPALPGCSSQGETRKDALANILEAILLVLDVLKEDDVPIPVETPDLVSKEISEILKARSQDHLPLTLETTQVELPAGVTV